MSEDARVAAVADAIEDFLDRASGYFQSRADRAVLLEAPLEEVRLAYFDGEIDVAKLAEAVIAALGAPASPSSRLTSG